YYTNLPANDYTFQVQAATAGGEWGTPGARTFFRIDPRFSAWFLILGLAALLVAGLGLYKLRGRQVRAREAALASLVDERTRALQEETVRAEEARQRAEQADRAK